MLPWPDVLNRWHIHLPVSRAPDTLNWPELFGTALTALIAAAVGAYATGHVTRQANDAQFRRQELDRDTSAAFAMQQKLIRIYSSITSLRDDFVGGYARQISRRSPFLALNLRPFANPPSKIHFSSEELERIHRIGGNELLNLIADLDTRYNAIVESMSMYRDRWIALTDTWDGFLTEDGMLSTGRTAEELQKDVPRLHMLDDIASQAAVFTHELVDIAYAAMLDLYFARGSNLNLQQRMETVTPEGAKISIQSTPFKKKSLFQSIARRWKKQETVAWPEKPFPLYGTRDGSG